MKYHPLTVKPLRTNRFALKGSPYNFRNGGKSSTASEAASYLPCPVCGNTAKGILVGYDANTDQLKVYSLICNECGFKWRFPDGDLIECVKEYIKNHPIKSCLGVL